VYIAGVTEEYVTSVEELLGIMNAGATNRAVAATGMNEGSSRSHSVFTIVINQRDVVTSASKSAKLVLVDLAGSEMVRKTNASGQQLEEAKMINKSLSSLGLVIMALTDDKAQHVPYRDSKLTRILQDSLGGNSHTVLIVNCSPSSYNAPETVSTLRFGTRAKNIENKVQVNRVRSVEELENLLAKAERTIETQEAHILALNVQLRQALDASGAVAAATAAAATEGSAAAVDASASPVQLTAPSIASGDLESIAQLNATITKLQEELEEEREESLRLGNESAVMSELLREREQQISDATSMMKEAQKQFEAHRDRADQVVRELSRAQSEIDSLRAQINDDNSRHKFEVEELELSLKRHREENEKLLQAAANVVSSVADDMSAGSIPATIETAASAKLARPTASGAAMFNRTRVQNELSAIFRQKSVSPLSRDAEALVLDLVERYAMPMSPSAAGANSGNGGERWAHTRLLEKENQRKLTELSQQRLRLVEDLSLVTEKVSKIWLIYDA
jgi:kinesin family protein 5